MIFLFIVNQHISD